MISKIHSIINNLKNNKILFILISIVCIAVIYLMALFNVSFGVDEQFTIGIIHNTYYNVINLDSFDVHPPLYYLVLKLFLQVTSFWTTSILIKIFLARLFSFIVSVLVIVYGIRLLKSIGIHLHLIPILIFISIPSVLMYSIYIRMYILSVLFLFIELYNLINFEKYNNNFYLFVAIVSGTLAAYTHYFAAISAGLFLLNLFTKYIYNKKYKKSIKLFLSGILYIVIYIPWLIVAMKQFSMATSSQYNTNRIYTRSTYTFFNLLHLIEQSILSFVGGEDVYGIEINKLLAIPLLFIFIYLIYWSFCTLDIRFNNILLMSVSNLIETVLIGIFVSILTHPILVARYVFPSFAIFAFLISYVIYNYIKSAFKYPNKFRVIVFLLITVILLSNVTMYAKFSVHNCLSSTNIIENIKDWRKLRSRNIFIKNNKNNIWIIANDSIYLRPFNKKVVTNRLNNSNVMFGKSNITLLHGVYPNIKSK